jgi:hypothetical protein
MGEFFDNKWTKAIINILTPTLICLLGFWLTSRRSDSQELIKKVEMLNIEKASIPYVDNRDNELNIKLDKKVDKETFNLVLIALEDIKKDTRDTKLFLLNNSKNENRTFKNSN